MNQGLDTETPIVDATADASALSMHCFRPWLVLTGIAVLFSLTLELGIIEQLDSFLLYMTYHEVALDAGVALLVMLGFGILWWLFVLLVVKFAKVVHSTNRYSTALGWYLGLSLPLACFALNLFGAVKQLIFPQWHSGPIVWLSVFVLLVAGLLIVRVSAIEEFCRTRMVPVFWLHVALAVVAVIALQGKGVRLFHDYVRPAQAGTSSQSPDIYLITFDALAARDTSVYGCPRATTPNLEKFAKRSFTFDNFFANSNFTAPTTTSMETGKLPWSHRVFQQGGFLRGQNQSENLAELLRRRGYYTAMITSNQWAAPFRHRTLESYDAVEYAEPLGLSGAWFRYSNLTGTNTQYTLYDALLKRLGRAMNYMDAMIWPRRYPAPAEGVFDRARALLERSDATHPQFLWTHILPPHDPYLPPPPFRSRFLDSDRLTRAYDFQSLRNYALPPGVSPAELQARYDEMVLYADHAVGDFLDYLDRTGRLNDSIVIISADHGESFEHNWFLHAGPPLYDDLIHIPLLVHLPGQSQSAHISELAQQVDLLPTLLDLIGAPVPSWTDGTSLKSSIAGKRNPNRFIFSMNLEPNGVFDPISKGTLAVMDDEFKYVTRLDAKQEEAIYRYKTDRLEQFNLIASEPDAAKRLHEVLVNKLKEVNARPALRP